MPYRSGTLLLDKRYWKETESDSGCPPEESPSPTALPAPRHPSRVIAFAAVGAACAAEVALRWGADKSDMALRASGALWCLAALAAARTL